jgi:hypothetical protein
MRIVDFFVVQAYIKTAEVASFVCGYFIGDAPVAPGQSNYYEIPMVETANCTCDDAAVSVFTKVELMNDAFAALNTVLIPVVPVTTLDEHHAGWQPHLVPAYDAGTQVSTLLLCTSRCSLIQSFYLCCILSSVRQATLCCN